MIGTIKPTVKIAFLSALLAATVFWPGQAKESLPNKESPIMIELFTSEGCSSCPPADRLAIRLQRNSEDGREVIILSEHVDYWNQLGWQDKYSSAQFTARQQDYARVLGQTSVYTPEAVVDGIYGVVGSNDRSLHEAIERCALNQKASLHLSAEEETSKDPLKKKVTISTTCPAALAGNQAELYIAVTEDSLTSNVRSGENSGAVLSHTGVVRCLRKLSNVLTLDKEKGLYTTQITLNPQWKKQDLRLVAFLQDPTTQKIWGANQIKIN